MLIHSLVSLFIVFFDILSAYPISFQDTIFGDPVIILSVSTVLGMENSVPTGSVMGGTTLYMRVQGLDQMASFNTVFIGRYPCLISVGGVNGLSLVCETTKPVEGDPNLLNLEIVIRVTGKRDSKCTFSSTYCFFSYQRENTPILQFVAPRANYPKGLSHWKAEWKIVTTLEKELKGQFIGSNLCDRVNLQNSYQSQIELSDGIVSCEINEEIEAGFYSYTLSTRQGYQKTDLGVKQKQVFFDQTYDSKIIPIIKSLSTNYASPKGLVLVINGFGFSSNPINNSVFITNQAQEYSSKILSSTSTQIIVQLPPVIVDQSASSATNDINLHFEGSGLFYTRYNLTGLNESLQTCDQLKVQLEKDPTQFLNRTTFDGIYPEPDILNTFGVNYGEYFRGFLKAPITGNYRFFLASDDCSKFFIQTAQSKQAISPEQPVAFSSRSPYRDYWYEYSSATTQISKSLQLIQDEYYFIELFHVNKQNKGYVTLSMEIDNNEGERKSNSQAGVWAIKTNYNPIKEIIEINIYNSDANQLLAGTYQLIFINDLDSQQSNYTTVQIIHNSTAEDIKFAIENCGSGYKVSINVTKLDKSGTEVSIDSVNFSGFKYLIIFDSYRMNGQDSLPIIKSFLTGGTLVSKVLSIQKPCDPISGTFAISMTINQQNYQFQTINQDSELSFDFPAEYIANNIERITNIRPIVWTEGQAQDGWTWRIKLQGHVDSLSSIQVDENNLISGNGPVTLSIENTVPESNNQIFEPIPNELLFTYSDKPQVYIKTNNILAGCASQTACDFIISESRTPTLTNYSVDGSKLSLIIESSKDQPLIKASDLTITFLAADCSNIKITNSQSPYILTCDLEQFQGSNLQQNGLNQFPIVHDQSIGYILIGKNVKGQDVPITINSITPNSGSPDGGTELIITGTGFAKNLNTNFTITFNQNLNVKPISINNTCIVVETPININPDDGLILQNSYHFSLSNYFTVDQSKRIEITSLQSNKLSCYYRDYFNITGTNFGTSIEDIKVKLISNSTQYNLNISTIQDTLITVYLKEKKNGIYYLVVNRKGYGNSFANDNKNQLSFAVEFDKVYLYNGSQARGALSGGQTIIIPLQYFMFPKVQLVIGNTSSDNCWRSWPYIACITPPLSIQVSQIAQPVKLILDNQYETTCLAIDKLDCAYQYQQDLTPTLDQYPQDSQFISNGSIMIKSKTYNVGDTETLTGQNLADYVYITFYQNNVEQQKLKAQVLANSFKYTIPNLPPGEYSTYITNDYGLTNKYWITDIKETLFLKIIDVQPTFPAPGGQLLTIKGEGFTYDYYFPMVIAIGTTSCSSISGNGTFLSCIMGRQTQPTVNLTISKMPSANNSGYPSVASFMLSIGSVDSYPIIDALTVNDTDTFDDNLKAYRAQSGKIILQFFGNRLIFQKVFSAKLKSQNQEATGSLIIKNETSITVMFSDLLCGVFKIELQFDDAYAFFKDFDRQRIIIKVDTPVSNNPIVSYTGGATVNLTNTGFSKYDITLCEFKSSGLSNFIVPEILTYSLMSRFQVFQTSKIILPSQLTLSSDSPINGTYFFDLLQSTFYFSSNDTCFVQVSAGVKRSLKLDFFRFLPRLDIAVDILQGAAFEYTIDYKTWIVLLSIDKTIHSGWNYYAPQKNLDEIKAIRFYDSRGQNGSSCQLSELEIRGWLFEDQTDQSEEQIVCDAVMTTNGVVLDPIISAATLSTSVMPIVDSVTPKFGSFREAAIITITGKGFISNQTKVLIDEIPCVIKNISETTIVCQTGLKSGSEGFYSASGSYQKDGLFQVLVNGNLAINYQQFRYAYRWSEVITWKYMGKFYPQEGDTVKIYRGDAILVDVQTPKLKQIIVDGTLIVSDEIDTSIDAESIIIRKGSFYIGTETQQHQHKVVITLHGDESDDQIVQIADVGSKALACIACKLIINGKERKPIWTLLSITADAGAIQIKVEDPVDWKAGECVVIASSNFDHKQSETRCLIAISDDNKTLTLDKPLQFRHYSATEKFGSETFTMQTEVGLLTRNIVIQGSESLKKYGYHLMALGNSNIGTNVQISYAEFKNGGQQSIKGRYPIHFHLNGISDRFFIIGNSIHDCYARCITIQGVQFLNISNNICYNTYGHGIALEDGTETDNIIESNLVIGTKASQISSSDLTVASFWITSPKNKIKKNRAGGSDWNGFAYKIKEHPDGPSSTFDICPTGLNIIEFNENWSHSNKNAGLDITYLAPRLSPCDIYENYSTNPSLQANFENFNAWKNTLNGIQLNQVENILISNIKIADTRYFGISYLQTNSSTQGSLVKNSLIIGYSINNSFIEENYSDCQAVNVTDGIKLQDIKLFNFVSKNDSSEIGKTDDNNNGTSNNETNNCHSNQTGTHYWSESTAWDSCKLPQQGDNIIIPASQTIILDIDPPKLQNLTILGTLIFDERREISELQVENILLSGQLLAGNSSRPFPGKIRIILNGQNKNKGTDSQTAIKTITVMGGLELYSTPPETVWTRLTAFANIGQTKIQLTECSGWNVGDQIVLGPSGSDPQQKEKKTITATNECEITVDTALEFAHYGSPFITINKDGIGQLDMRAVVAHLTRNILIEGSLDESEQGCRLIVSNEQDTKQGYAILHGVEFNNCGQTDPDFSGLEFRDLAISESEVKTNEVFGGSFHDSNGIMMTVKNSQKVIVQNNIFFSGVQALVQINNSQNIKFQNNALIYVEKRKRIQKDFANWAVLGNFIYMNEKSPTAMKREFVDISGNVGQGSQDTGFFIMSSSCKDASQSSFYNNQCSGSVLACFAIRQSDGKCDQVQGLSAYHSGVGIMFAVNSEMIKLEQAIAAENKVGIVLKMGANSIQDNSIYFSASYITALARPECPQCYSGQLNSYCNQIQGLKMGTVSSLSYPPISQLPSDQLDLIQTIQRVDLRVYIKNVEFNNFRLTYDNLAICSKNTVFRTNEKAHDMTGQHYLQNTSCSNCEFDSLLYQMRDSDWSKVGYNGGCGSFECTGQKNVLIEDQSGQFFGEISQAISNNTYFGPHMTNCKRIELWNGYWCSSRNITVLMFMSVAPDYNKRTYSPVYLTSGVVYNKLNSFIEWNWNGKSPVNTRESKFVSLVRVNSVIIMNNTGVNPTSSEYWLSKRSDEGSSSDFVIIQQQFSLTQVIQVIVDNAVIQSGITVTGNHYDLQTMTETCGAHNFYYENKTIQFVVNAQIGCKVRISVKNSLLITTKLSVKRNIFSAPKFLNLAISQLGGNPLNYVILHFSIFAKRLLSEENQDMVIDVDWGIVDDIEIGKDVSEESTSKLGAIASSLESFNIPAEMGTILEQSTTVEVINTLNFGSTENQNSTDPTGDNNNEIDTKQNDTIPNQENPNSNNSNQSEVDTSQIIKILNEGVNDQDSVKNDDEKNSTINNQEKSKDSASSSNTVTIIVSTVCPIVGVSIIIIGLLYYKKAKKSKEANLRTQKYQFDTIKIDAIDPQIPMKATQVQSVQ